jgi:drug/metabolite transporter (DMT)-like permease
MINSKAFIGFTITFIGSVLFSTKAVIVKKAFADTSIDALTLLTLRMTFSLPFFLIAAFFVNKSPASAQLTKKQWIYIVILGLFGYYLSSYFDFVGLQYISAGLERLILFFYPIFVLLMNRWFFGQPITKVQMLASILTFIGIGVAYIHELTIDTSNPYFFLGTGLIFLCSLTYAFYIAGSSKVIPAIGASRFTAYAMLASTLGIFVHYILRGDYSGFSEASGMWGYGLLLGIIATALPTFMLSAGLLRIGANNVAIISAIGPVSTILQAHWILGEPIHTGQMIGTAMVIAGVLLIGWKARETGGEKA